MDYSEENTKENPRGRANILSYVLFGYMVPIFKKGYGKQLDIDDLYKPLKSDKSKILGDRLEKQWNALLIKCKNTPKEPSYLKALLLTFWPELLFLASILFVISLILELTQPIFLGKWLNYFKVDSTITKEEAYYYASCLCIVNLLIVLFSNHFIVFAFQYGMQIRTATCALIYRKALRLSRNALTGTSPGQIVNLLSNDVSRIDTMMVYLNYSWAAPIQCLIIVYFLFRIAGLSGLIGIIPIVLVTTLQTFTGNLIGKYRKQTAARTDERVRLMNEIVTGIQVIKMYAWELSFSKLIKIARKVELKIVKKTGYLNGIFVIFNFFTTRAALFCTLLAMYLSDQPITASKVFVIISYYNLVARIIGSLFIRCVQEIAEFLIAVKRIEKFLLGDEFEIEKSLECNLNINNIEKDTTRLRLKDISAKWSKTQEETLKNISFSVKDGELLGIVGPVGSGKSSILECILGELDITSGQKEINGVISYASQEPWLFSSSVRQNILFGEKFNSERYKKVIKVCNLQKDFEQFPNGDLTMVADRGASLSGGQKARINLARAVYREADIYLLDDPLSAVDIHVSKHIYNYCINEFLAEKARILVTHQVHHLKNADNIVMLDEGSTIHTGTYKDISKYFKKDSRSKLKSISSQDDSKDLETKLTTRTISLNSIASKMSVTESFLEENPEEEEQTVEEKYKVKELQEDSSKGKVKGSMFLKYHLSGGNACIVGFIAMLFVLTQILSSGIDYFISFYIKIEEMRHLNVSNYENTTAADLYNMTNLNYTNYETTTPTELLNMTNFNINTENVTSSFDSYFNSTNLWTSEICMNVYTFLLIILFIIAATRSILFCKIAVKSSQTLHDNLFKHVINANLRFFDTNPSGRILNRFSKDLGAIDEILPKNIVYASQLLLNALGSMIIIVLINYYFIGFILVISVFFWFIRNVFLKTSKNIKRVEGILRSPAVTHLTASLQGLPTIRAFGAQSTLSSEYDKHQDNHTSAYSLYFTAASAYGFYMDFICMFFTTAITFTFLVYSEELKSSGGDVGLAITQALGITVMIQWGMKQSAEITNQLISVERILEYNLLPAEKPPKRPIEPPHQWPNNGKIIFKNMSLKYYEEMPYVLKDFNIVINSREKVGIVGRTGAGKTSLISALFRLAIVEGNIIIDDLDTEHINLQTLRSRISIIPQDPVLFSGTLRYNLDPFEEYDDYVLQNALKEVELNDTANIINRLEYKVMDRGGNYSIGQRQLICLARAIVRNNKILMLDEATANVDPQTDAVIQKTIRKKFSDCTVLTIAHRLNTIMDSDKIMVIDKGSVVEFDHPYVLLQNSKSVFYEMVNEAGESEKSNWMKVAKENYKHKYSS